MSRPNITPHTAEEMEAMSIRDLLNMTEHWSRALGDSTFNDKEIAMVRLANRIYIRRREDLRRVAPELLVIAERLAVYIESAGLIPPCVREARKIITQAKGGE